MSTPTPTQPKHTSGPLTLELTRGDAFDGSETGLHPDAFQKYLIISGNKPIAATVPLYIGAVEKSKPDAARLVACWNACEGINPEAVPELLAALRVARTTLTGCVGVNDANEAERAETIAAIGLAIAKAEGGAK